MTEKRDPVEEAKRYISNAKEILRDKAIKDGDYYTDSKYVRMAGDTAWKGCLLALDSVLNIKKKTRKSIDDYKAEAAKMDKKLLLIINAGYEVMHLYMGYDGNKSYKVSVAGIETAQNIIKWCETRRAKTLKGVTTGRKTERSTVKTVPNEILNGVTRQVSRFPYFGKNNF